MNVFEELKWRGMVHSTTPGSDAMLAHEKITCYNGFDPSAKSLHMGNLIPIMGLVRMQRYGHTPIAIAGGGTGMIGDPGGRTQERQLLSVERLGENVAGIRSQLERFLDFKVRDNPARLINNADWLMKLGLINFLRDTGKHFTVNYMLGKESVQARLEREDGISFTEFSYMLLQAYDYLNLYREYGCRLQMGGSDQWGNILAGVDLIKRVEATTNAAGIVTGYTRGEPHALVYPLLTTASGEKFGKSEGNAIWLDASMTSPYRFYQYWFNVDDQDVITYLKWFTLLGPEDLAPLEDASRTKPAKREAQRALARDVTLAVHGQSGLEQAERVTAAFFGGRLEDLRSSELEDALAGMPVVAATRNEIVNSDLSSGAFLVQKKIVPSMGEFRRLVAQGGIYYNDERVTEIEPLSNVKLLNGHYWVVRIGAKRYHLVLVRD